MCTESNWVCVIPSTDQNKFSITCKRAAHIPGSPFFYRPNYVHPSPEIHQSFWTERDTGSNLISFIIYKAGLFHDDALHPVDSFGSSKIPIFDRYKSLNSMNRYSISGFVLFCQYLIFCSVFSCKPKTDVPPYVIAIHGGAGTIGKKNMTPEREEAYKQALTEALDLGEKILAEGGSALDAVEKTVEWLENNPLFNAGKGAVFTHEGTHELDASIMDGKTLAAGAVGGVRTIRNPIKLARKVMENSPHVFLAGRGAESFGLLHGLDTVSNSWFDTEHRRDSWQKALEKERQDSLQGQGYLNQSDDIRFGTVGCVALDRNGNLAAATSTGGMTNKRWGRLGDSPVIGAGTYAENGVAAVSCTGDGEYFIRSAVAYDLVARMKYGGQSLKQAGDAIIHQKLPAMGGMGGLISLDAQGNIHLPFNSEGMYRAWAKPGSRSINIFESFN